MSIDYDEHGRERMDPRWYAIHNAKTHFNEGLYGAIDDALREYTAVAIYAAEEREARRE